MFNSFDTFIFSAPKRFIKSGVKLWRMLLVDYDIYQLKRASSPLFGNVCYAKEEFQLYIYKQKTTLNFIIKSGLMFWLQ